MTRKCIYCIVVGENFVTRKISRGVAKISLGQADCIELGNLNARRDWGHARDYVEAMWLMLQQSTPVDYVIASGESHSVRDFVERAFAEIGREIEWRGEGADEIGVERGSEVVRVRVNSRFHRPAEVEHLEGDASKARRELGWTPKVTFAELVSEMVKNDITLMKSDPTA